MCSRSRDILCSLFLAEHILARPLADPIPPELENLVALQYLYLLENRLSGESRELRVARSTYVRVVSTKRFETEPRFFSGTSFSSMRE